MLEPEIDNQVGSGESYGEGGDEEEECLDDQLEAEDDEEDDWEDLEEWRPADPAISVSSKWSSLPHCPPPPRPLTNNVNHR